VDVSVIIPAYNEARLIGACVGSVRAAIAAVDMNAGRRGFAFLSDGRR
jgi:hypothetical protein